MKNITLSSRDDMQVNGFILTSPDVFSIALMPGYLTALNCRQTKMNKIHVNSKKNLFIPIDYIYKNSDIHIPIAETSKESIHITFPQYVCVIK
jgi:hypothetical protein